MCNVCDDGNGQSLYAYRALRFLSPYDNMYSLPTDCVDWPPEKTIIYPASLIYLNFFYLIYNVYARHRRPKTIYHIMHIGTIFSFFFSAQNEKSRLYMHLIIIFIIILWYDLAYTSRPWLP